MSRNKSTPATRQYYSRYLGFGSWRQSLIHLSGTIVHDEMPPRPSLYYIVSHHLHPPRVSSPLRTTRCLSSTPPPTPSTTARGTSYEHLALISLRRLAFTLKHVGGRSDRGIDLLGHWHPPTQESSAADKPNLSIPVIVQCKAHKRTPNPAWIRELEGALAAAPGEWREGVGVLACKGKATVGVREAVMGAGRGVIWVQLDGDGEEARVEQMLWNRKVKELVGEGLGVGFVYLPREKGRVVRDLRLSLEGRVWEHGKKNGELEG